MRLDRKKYIVRLTTEERERLQALVSKGRTSARKIGRARVLLNVDADGPNWTDQLVAGARVDWQFTSDDARIHLKHLYPRFQV